MLSQALGLLAWASPFLWTAADTSPFRLAQSDFIESGKQLPDRRRLLHVLLPSVLFLIKDLAVHPLLALNFWSPWFSLPSARITDVHRPTQLITEERC